MSAGVGVGKDVPRQAAQDKARKPVGETAAPALRIAASGPISSLVQQIFFPAMVQRTRVFFAAADSATNVSPICEHVGRLLAERSGAMVAIVGISTSGLPTPVLKKRPSNTAGAEWWCSYSLQLAENLWRVPSSLMTRQSQLESEISGLPFDYMLFEAAVGDAETPLFCSLCDGAVLVLTANRTHRESALRAKEYLLQCDVELLGTVLDARTFPVPETIYRRL
jgi:hypothetical protein